MKIGLRFSLRDLVWLILLCSVAFAWIVDRRQISLRLVLEKDELIRDFVRQQQHTEGVHVMFGHRDFPHPTDPNIPKDGDLTDALRRAESGELSLEQLNERFGDPVYDTNLKQSAPPVANIPFAVAGEYDQLPVLPGSARLVYWTVIPKTVNNPVVLGLTFDSQGKAKLFRCLIDYR
ncbi:hypothetical protein NA78x_005952 [Anatilimnocola sp. NA78]|uniref:hypothetical protein n=1 Tax=Anatilimnocola sp. NA78 TaxID=3415683 RepID=UPI003CE55589